MKDLRSEVELRKEEVKEGTRLLYTDIANCMAYTILDVDSESFECINEDTKELEVYFFSELQHGWTFR